MRHATRTNDLGALLSDSQKLVVSETLDSGDYGKTRVSDFKASDQGLKAQARSSPPMVSHSRIPDWPQP